MADLTADDVFFENEKLGRVCLGGGKFEYVLICTRLGDFEVWDGLHPRNSRCIAGAGYGGPSKIEVGGRLIFHRETAVEE